MLIFQQDHPSRSNTSFIEANEDALMDYDAALLRDDDFNIPNVSELDVVRHYTGLSQKNFSIDTQFYPLGSCTMKYNPRAVHRLCLQEAVLNRHPLLPDSDRQGFLSCLHTLQHDLMEITGMTGCCLAPMAGAQGELAGVQMIQAYHRSRGDTHRVEMLVPAAAHGTNPASAVMSGFVIKEIPVTDEGDVDFAALEAAISPNTAGIMLTNPSTLGVFERDILKISKMIHAKGGLLYYDGANLNAILGKARPGDMGFDVMHVNLHKTFATPHGGGGPGAGPVLANETLRAFLPIPYVIETDQGFRFADEADAPQSIGRLSAFMGNAAVLLRAYLYIKMLGLKGLVRAGEIATLNANYLMKRLAAAGFDVTYPTRRATHEFVISLAKMSKETGVTAKDFAKRLLDYGIHAPTTYFPLLVPECLLIEPTETESKLTLDKAVDIFSKVYEEAYQTPELVLAAPHHLPIKRLDDVMAAKALDVCWEA